MSENNAWLQKVSTPLLDCLWLIMYTKIQITKFWTIMKLFNIKIQLIFFSSTLVLFIFCFVLFVGLYIV